MANRTPKDKRSQEEIEAQQHCKEVCLRYSLPTLMGQWYDNIAKREDMINTVKKRFALERTFVQRKEKVMNYLHVFEDIAKYNEYLIYGAPVQIVTDLTYAIAREREEPITKLVLSALITEKQISEYNILDLQDGCLVTSSVDDRRIRRNVFSFVGCDSMDKKYGKPVFYSDCVFIKVFNPGNMRNVYLRCEVPHIDNFGLNGNRFSVGLSENADSYCKFRIINVNPRLQALSGLSPVPSNSRICINHTMSNRPLTVETDHIYNSILVGQERLVSCSCERDVHVNVASENFWITVTKRLDEQDPDCICPK